MNRQYISNLYNPKEDNTLDISELMIGDLVYVTDYPMKREIKRVVPEHFLRSLCIFGGIPLTKDILKKNGFILDTYMKGGSSKFWVANDFVMGEHGQLAIGAGMGWHNTDLIYVHQLQRAFKLCGITREIIV